MEFRTVLCLLIFVKSICGEAENVQIEEKKKDLVNGTKSLVEIYRNLFKMKRKEQILMIEKVIMIEDIEKKDKFIGIMLNGIIETILKGKKILEGVQFKAGDPFPDKNEVKDGYSMVLESTAIFTDVIVRFPFISERKLKRTKHQNWKETIEWAKNIAQKSGVFIKKHQEILRSLGQELKLDEIDPNYKNPFKVRTKHVEKSSEERKKLYEEKKRREKMAAKKKKKSGPRLTKNEL